MSSFETQQVRLSSRPPAALVQPRWVSSLLTTLIPSAVIPVGLAALFNLTLHAWRWPQEPFHALVEGVGSFAAILLALMILSMRRSGELRPAYLWIATTLMGMGLLDGFHASVYPGEVFVWLHSVATMIGGVFFAFIILPDRISELRALRTIPFVIALFSLLVGLLSVAYPAAVPTMIAEGRFTPSAEALNVVGGLGFVAAWLHFTLSERGAQSAQERLFLANHCLLFGMAGLLFHFSALWDATWWLWHVLRLFAYLIILGFFVRIYLRNIARIRQSELRTKEIAESLQTLVDNVVDGIIAIDARGRIESFNPAAERIFGYRRDQVLGANVSILMPAPFDALHDGYLERFARHSDPTVLGSVRELSGQRRSGSTFPMELALSAMQLEGRVGFIGIVRDITERRRVERMKNEFISTVSHELRTPLTSIRGSLGLISGGALGELPDQMSSMLQIASNNTERLLLLINDILDLQKIESGKMDFRFEVVDLADLLQQAVADNRTYADQFGVRLRFDPPPEALRIFADRARMMQVLANLLSNAAKFSPKGDEVTIEATRRGSLVRISVRDRGPGIPESARTTIFEKFTQVDGTDRKSRGGTGLGLSIARLLVEKHGGNIAFETATGVGTTFYFDLPSLADIPEAPLKERACEPGPRILVVEDDRDISLVLEKMLSQAGFRADVASTAREARAILRERGSEYQAMTLDVLLPDDNGLEMLRDLRAEGAIADLPVIVLSVRADEERHTLQGGAVGVVGWLSKPIDPAQLHQAIRSASRGTRPPRVLHVEDDSEIHQIVAAMLGDRAVLSWAESVTEGRRRIASEDFDLVLLDVGLPDGSGLDLLDLIEKRVHPPRVVIFSAQDIDPAIATRVSGVLVKAETSNDALLDTILGSIRR